MIRFLLLVCLFAPMVGCGSEPAREEISDEKREEFRQNQIKEAQREDAEG